MKLQRKAEMGIGTLIIFIALLLVAAIAAGVLIQTSGSLQEKALTTGDQAKSQISTNVRTIEVSATDGSNGTLTDFKQIVKLSPGSDAIKISQVLFTINTYDMTGNLQYREGGISSQDPINGYYTLGVNEMGAIETSVDINFTDDFNDDQILDYMNFDGNKTITVFISDGASHDEYNVTLTGIDCTVENPVQVNSSRFNADVSNAYVSNIYMDGPCYNGTIPASTTFQVNPTNPGTGYFAIQYLQRGPNPVDGNLQRGDVVQILYESPRPVGEDETVRLNFIPKIGTPTLTQFITPEVISTERVYLYP